MSIDNQGRRYGEGKVETSSSRSEENASGSQKKSGSDDVQKVRNAVQEKVRDALESGSATQRKVSDILGKRS
jgi:hypothetical protein